MADDPQEVCTGSPKRTAPHMAAFRGDDDVTYFLFIEEILFNMSASFTKVLMLWFVSHYVFNLEYCKHVRDVALFIQEFVFGLPEGLGIKEPHTSLWPLISTSLLTSELSSDIWTLDYFILLC